MSGKHANRIRGEEWRQGRKAISLNTVRNRRKSRLSGKRHYRIGYRSS